MGPQTLPISTRPEFVGVGDHADMTVHNVGAVTVYYGNSPAVSSVANVGSIAAGSTVTVTAGQYFVTASGSTSIFVSAVAAAPLGGVIPFSVPGVTAVGAGLPRFYMPRDGTIQSVEASLGIAPSSPHIVDVNKNGTTIFTTQGDRPTIASGQFTSGLKSPAVTAVARGDYLTVDIDEVGVAPVPTYIINTAHSYVPGPATTYDVTRHASTTSGDLLIVVLVSSGAVTWSASGFTQIGTHGVVSAATNTRVSRFWRIDNGAAGPFTFTASGSATAISASSMIYRGTHATVPIESATQADHASGTAYVLDATHTTVNNGARVLVSVVSDTSVLIPAGPPIAHTVRRGFSPASIDYIHAADILIPTAGALGAMTVTVGSSMPGSSARIGIRPSGAAVAAGSDLTVVVRYTES